MALVVQKYGGSSLAEASLVRQVAKRIVNRVGQGDEVVVVVSAMGNRTEELLSLSTQISKNPEKRELDLLLSTGEIVSGTVLSMALKALGQPAIALSGAQAGIGTDRRYGHARILKVDPRRVVKELSQGNVVIVAGFQGITEELDITTLGRGGSDISAVALAATLKAKCCEIYTDVDGVYTADPTLEPAARRLPDISYEEMLELASYGAKVLHSRAVEMGSVYQVPILVASSFHEGPGTIVHGGDPTMEQRSRVMGIAQDTDVGRITLRGVPDRPGVASKLFEPLAEAGISVDTIVQNAGAGRLTDVTFTVSESDLDNATKIVNNILSQIDAAEVLTEANLAKISIVGAGMQSSPGYAARMFRTLFEAGINVEMISTSEIRITCIIAEAHTGDAVRALHKAFELEEG